jgi:hypothetical protein
VARLGTAIAAVGNCSAQADITAGDTTGPQFLAAVEPGTALWRRTSQLDC